VPRPRRRNPWTSTGEVFIWVLFAALLFPAGFAGWAVGHYTSLGDSTETVTRTVAIGSTSTPTTTSSATTTSSGTTSSGTTSSGKTTTSSGGGGDAQAGKAVFAANGCASCHTFKPANATGTVGPDLDSAPAADAKADNNMELADFIKQSIEDPDAYIAKGYAKGIMPSTFDESLSGKQMNDLVAFIVSGSSGS
jgi:cytochrome c551/c552